MWVLVLQMKSYSLCSGATNETLDSVSSGSTNKIIVYCVCSSTVNKIVFYLYVKYFLFFYSVYCLGIDLVP